MITKTSNFQKQVGIQFVTSTDSEKCEHEFCNFTFNFLHLERNRFVYEVNFQT